MYMCIYENALFHKFILQVEEFLVQWDGFSSYDCTWEPKHHLPSILVEDFKEPSTPLSRDVLFDVSDKLLTAFHDRLHRRTGPHFYVEFRHDVFNLLFPRNPDNLFYKCDFSSFIFPTDWDVVIYSLQGEGRKIKFPIFVKQVLKWSKKQYQVGLNQTLTLCKQRPLEFLKIEIGTSREIIENIT